MAEVSDEPSKGVVFAEQASEASNAPSKGDVPKEQASEASSAPSKVVVSEDQASDPAPRPKIQVVTSQWLSTANRKRTNIEDANIESRPFKHAHIFRRPHAMQHYNTHSSTSAPNSPFFKTSSNTSAESREGRKSDNILVQLARVDLFIDLVWVGIVANLSANFGEQSFTDSGVSMGEALGEYILLFMPVWRLWDNLREFGSNFYKDDIVQRLFMIWILLLSVLYGINAPFAFVPEDDENSLTLLIAVYLIARASFILVHIYQATFLPFLRRQVLFSLVCSTLSGSLWIAAIYVSYPARIALLVVANTVEHPIAVFLASPASDRLLLTGGWEKKTDYEHYIERMEGFFIIILGEGVFRLIEGSPSGIGLNHRTGTVLTALLMYYVLHYIYFNGDQSKEFVHALKRRWWRSFLWKFFHLILFAALLLLAASVLFLVEHDATSHLTTSLEAEVLSTSATDQDPDSSKVINYTRRALWSASTALAISLLTMTALALLNRSMDKTGTLVVNANWLRLATRLPALAVICCLPLFPSMSGASWCGGATTTLYVVFFYEWIAGMEKEGWKVVEPRREGDNLFVGR